MNNAEILAPAGNRECLEAAVRCGANAVYLGGKALNARRTAANFDENELREAVRYCRARSVKVYLAVNTLIFDNELADALNMIRIACSSGVDALIVQDMAVAALARKCAPEMPLHASTQTSVHNAEGASVMEKLGFSRIVLARELSLNEIADIARNTTLTLECFVHGALCVSVSGQCYFSAMLGGRSGNRGLCAQPCRLPMSCGGNERCFSLKDLSLVERIPEMLKAGVFALKIEGRLKRAEYVAAAVTAVRQMLAGEQPQLDTLRRVFSRSGFTDGYLTAKTGFAMFGSRSREDVLAASPALLSGVAASYRCERPIVPVDFSLTLAPGVPAGLTVSDSSGISVHVKGDIPLAAITAPTTPQKAAAALSRTGATPFYAAGISAEIGDGLMLPASGLNDLRRRALDELLSLRGEVIPRQFRENNEITRFFPHAPAKPGLRASISSAQQFCGELAESCDLVIVPAGELNRLDAGLLAKYANRTAVGLPRTVFGRKEAEKLSSQLCAAREKGVKHALVGNPGSVEAAMRLGFTLHGDWPLNIANSLALSEYERLGLSDVTLSVELTKNQISRLGGHIPRGVAAYGRLPLMLTRCGPGGRPVGKNGSIVKDRRGSAFPVRRAFGAYELLNCVPLFLADRLSEFTRVDFFTLYFTLESPEQCLDILKLYLTGGKTDAPKTRGLYFRGVI